MKVRVVAFGRIDDRLREDLAGLGDEVDVRQASPDEEPLELVAALRPHLIALGEDPPVAAASLAGLEPVSGPVPILSLRDEPGADLVLGAEPSGRSRALATARKLARLREGWAAARDDEAERLLRRLDHEFVRAARYRHPLALAAVGIDGLRELAEIHGDRTLDAFLESLAEAAHRGVREVDVVFRPTRGEVWAILPETEPSGARSVAERLRTLTGRILFKPPAGAARRSLPLRATASVGLATCPSEGIQSAADLLSHARAALDAARLEGGDRVVATADGPGGAGAVE